MVAGIKENADPNLVMDYFTSFTEVQEIIAKVIQKAQ